METKISPEGFSVPEEYRESVAQEAARPVVQSTPELPAPIPSEMPEQPNQAGAPDGESRSPAGFVEEARPTPADGSQELLWDKDELPDNLQDALALLQKVNRMVISPANSREEFFLKKRLARVGQRWGELQQGLPVIQRHVDTLLVVGRETEVVKRLTARVLAGK